MDNHGEGLRDFSAKDRRNHGGTKLERLLFRPAMGRHIGENNSHWQESARKFEIWPGTDGFMWPPATPLCRRGAFSIRSLAF